MRILSSASILLLVIATTDCSLIRTPARVAGTYRRGNEFLANELVLNQNGTFLNTIFYDAGGALSFSGTYYIHRGLVSLKENPKPASKANYLLEKVTNSTTKHLHFRPIEDSAYGIPATISINGNPEFQTDTAGFSNIPNAQIKTIRVKFFLCDTTFSVKNPNADYFSVRTKTNLVSLPLPISQWVIHNKYLVGRATDGRLLKDNILTKIAL